MTFDAIVTEVKDRLNITSSTSTTRIGRLVNQVYRTVTTEIGLSVTRNVGVSGLTSIGSSQVTITGCEKIGKLWYSDSAGMHQLDEVNVDNLRGKTLPEGDTPTQFGIWRMGSGSVTVQLNMVAATAYSLSGDGQTTTTALSGSNEPAFPESFHDILVEGVLIKEYRKDEKTALAKDSEITYERRLSALRMWIAKSKSKRVRQADNPTTPFGALSGGGSGSSGIGQTALTITELWTFDRDPSAPFAVSTSSAVVANLDADKVDGEHGSAFHDAALLTGLEAAIPSLDAATKIDDNSIYNVKVNAAAAIASSKLDLSAITQDVKFIDATYDIGKTGATRPRDGFFSRNVTVGSALVVVGNSTLTGALLSNLIFTDATYDIGASGATRPRDLFLSRDAVIGRNASTVGKMTVGSSFSTGVVALTDGATPALDASLGGTFTLSAAGNRTIAVPSNPVSGQKILIAHTASGGARTLALNSGAGGFRFGEDVPALSATTSGKTDYIGAIYNAAASFWDVIAYVKGY